MAAIYNTGTITVTDSNFTSNYGGAIYNTGNATIYAINDNVVFEKNRNNSSYNDIYNLSELNLNDAVIMLGIRSDVNNLLQAADCFLFPSVFEGLGIVAIEAQAAGFPCICSNIGI